MTDQTSSTRVERRSTLSLPTASGAPTQPRAGRTTTRDSQVGAADSRDETVSAPHDLRAADGLPIPATDRHTGASSIVATPQDDDRHDDTDLTPDDDDPFPADKDDEGDAWAAASRPGHRVMDRGAIIKAMLASGYDGGSYDHLSSGEEQRARTLVRYRDMNLVRPHLVGSPAMLARLDALEVAQPNFAAVTGSCAAPPSCRRSRARRCACRRSCCWAARAWVKAATPARSPPRWTRRATSWSAPPCQTWVA